VTLPSKCARALTFEKNKNSRKMWGFELQGVVPDIVTMGKVYVYIWYVCMYVCSDAYMCVVRHIMRRRIHVI
jgi:hypothetical protein